MEHVKKTKKTKHLSNHAKDRQRAQNVLQYLVMHRGAVHEGRALTQNGCCRPYLAGQDVSKGRECVIESLVINRLVQILDKDVANAALSEGRVTLRPHDTKRSALNHVEVHRVQGSLSYNINTRSFVMKVQDLKNNRNDSNEIRDSLERDVTCFTLVHTQNGVTWRLQRSS